MKDEIKEILDRLKRIDHKEYIAFEFADSATFDEMARCFEERKKMADYITNLQEENERLNKDLDTSIEICNNRQKEIVRLNNIIDELEKYLHTICIGDATFEEIGITQSILNKLKKLKEGK